MNRRCNLEDTFDCSEKPMSDKEWITGWAGCSGWYTQQGQHEGAEGVTIPLGVLRALGE